MNEENRYQHRRRFLQSNGAYSHSMGAPKAVRIHVPVLGVDQINFAIKEFANVSFQIGQLEETDLAAKLMSVGIILREMHCRLSDYAKKNIYTGYSAVGVPDEARIVVPLLSSRHLNNAKSEIKKFSSYLQKIPKRDSLINKQHKLYNGCRALSLQLKELADDSKMMPFNPCYDFRGVR